MDYNKMLRISHRDIDNSAETANSYSVPVSFISSGFSTAFDSPNCRQKCDENDILKKSV